MAMLEYAEENPKKLPMVIKLSKGGIWLFAL